MASKKNRCTPNPQSLDLKFKTWADEFLHSPVGFDGRTAEEVIRIDVAESKQIFKRELVKRKAHDEMKTLLTKDGLELKYWFVSKNEKPSKQVKILLHG